MKPIMIARALGPALSCLLAALPARAAEPIPAGEPLATITTEVAAERFGNAVVLCEQAQKQGDLSLELRAACGQAYVGLGDKLLAAGSPDNARQRWEQAVAIDPRLMDDAAFVQRLQGNAPKPKPKPGHGDGLGGSGGEVKPRPPKKRTPPPEEPRRMPANAGPRWDRGFGLGLSFGFDGLVALSVGWLTDETLLAEVTIGVVYPATDIRVRWLGLRNCVTPYLGAGLLVPFGEDDRMGLDIGSYESLYELGEAIHLDIGIAYTPMHRLDLHAGVAFITPMDQDHPDTVLFFPQFEAGASWFF